MEVNRCNPGVMEAADLFDCQLTGIILQHSMKLCTHQENKWQIIRLHIVRGGYFCPLKTVTHNIWPTKQNWAPRRERKKLGVGRRQAFSAAVCWSAFPANLAAAGFFKEGEEGGSVLVCADPGFVTQTCAAQNGWLSGSRTLVRSQPKWETTCQSERNQISSELWLQHFGSAGGFFREYMGQPNDKELQ